MRRSLSRLPSRLPFKILPFFYVLAKIFVDILLTISDLCGINKSFQSQRASSRMTLREFSWAVACL
jgi:hypothetical protein